MATRRNLHFPGRKKENVQYETSGTRELLLKELMLLFSTVTLTTLLNVDYRIPFKKIQILFGDLFGYAINESTVYSATKQFYKQLKVPMENIKSKIIEAMTAHADETGIRVEERLRWLHVATTEFYTYLFVHEKRGRVALESNQSILDKLTGWLVHDCWGSYFNFNELHHALCGAHILRELEGLIEIASFVSTARKHDKNVFSELFNTFSGYNFLTR